MQIVSRIARTVHANRTRNNADARRIPADVLVGRGETVQLKIKSPEDFWSGLIFIGIGVLAMYLSRDYPMGSALRMGPGYFPTWLGGIMIGFGVVIAALSLK